MGHEQTSSLLYLAEIVHWVALAFMGTVYTMRLFWILKFKAGKDRQAPGERFGNTTIYPALYSLANVAMPGKMESTRENYGFWMNFVLFHVCAFSGIFFAIISSAYPPFVHHKFIAFYFLLIFVGGFFIGLYRVIRRIKSPVLRLVSSPDDYFAMSTLTVWFALGVFAVSYILGWVENVNWMVAFYFVTSFFLFYVPFSKISHYLYYPFTRYYIGKTLGHRGSMPAHSNNG